MGWIMLLPAALLAGSGQCPSEAAAQPLADIIDADNAADLDRVMQFYVADVVWIPPAKPPIRGQTAVRQSYGAMYGEFRPHLTTTADEVLVGAGVARVAGTTGGWLEARQGGARRDVADAYEAILMCESGKWKVSSLRWWPRRDGPPPTK